MSGCIRIVWAACLLGLCAATGRANSRETPESAGAYHLAQAVNLYKLSHDGAMPRNWDDLAGVCNFEQMNKSLALRGTGPIQDRYQFVTQKLPYEQYGLEQACWVLLIRTVPLSERRTVFNLAPRRWRYLVYQRSDGTAASARASEDQVQTMLRKANVTISPKPHLPSVEYPDPANSYWLLNIVTVMGILFVGALVLQRVKKRSPKT